MVFFFFWSCSEWHSTRISFSVKSCDEVPRMDNELPVNAVLLAVVKVWPVSPECIEVLLLYKIFRWSATLWGSWLSLKWWSQALPWSSVLYCPFTCLEIVLFGCIFFCCLDFITVKAVMACNLVYHEILFKGSHFSIILFFKFLGYEEKRGIVHD